MPSSRGASQPRDRTQVSRIARGLYPLSHKGSPRILEWVADPFSRGSSWPRNWTRVSCIAGRFFTSWDTKEAQRFLYQRINILPRWMLKKRRCEKLCWVFVSPKDQDSGIWERVGEDEEHNSIWSDDHWGLEWSLSRNQIRQEEVLLLASQVNWEFINLGLRESSGPWIINCVH